MSKFQKFQGPLQKFQDFPGLESKFSNSRFSMTCGNPDYVYDYLFQTSVFQLIIIIISNLLAKMLALIVITVNITIMMLNIHITRVDLFCFRIRKTKIYRS